MKETCEHKNELTFIWYHTKIVPDEGYQKCPEFWDKEYNEKYVRLWQTMKPETPVEATILENGIGMCSQFGAQAGMTNKEMKEYCEKLFPMLKRWKK